MLFAKLLHPSRIVVVSVALLVTAQLSSAQTYTVLHSFTGGADGSRPFAGVTLSGTSNLFGGAGEFSLFRLRQTGSSWVLNPIFEFNGTDGEYPAGRETFGPGGALYGATGSGGLPECIDGGGCGLIFSMRPPSAICRSVSCPWTETVLYQFDPVSGIDGFQPNGGLIFDTSGNIYGTTQLGGLYGGGSVFQLTPSQGGWTENLLYSFGQLVSDGFQPRGNLIIDQAGSIIGTTQEGGAYDCLGSSCGVVFQLTRNGSGWTETVLHTFTDGPDGATPAGGLISDAAGNLYGLTEAGGPGNGGTLYELTPSDGGYTFQVLYAFTGNGLGYVGAVGILAIDSNGNLYGATDGQSAFGYGSIFKLAPANGGWTYTDLYDFTGGNNGAGPFDGPTLDLSGNLYGTTNYGGTGSCQGGCGVVWQLIP